MAAIQIRVKGLDEIERKLDTRVLLDPAIEEAKETIVDRIVKRPGRGMGAQNNQLSANMRPLGATIVSTLNRPRQTGRAWQDKNQSIVKGMAPNVIRKKIQRIEAAWAG